MTSIKQKSKDKKKNNFHWLWSINKLQKYSIHSGDFVKKKQ